MMSSVIPARLVFQCGHAALVSLPRIKGETSAQRADRVAREKSAAHTRACDFCGQHLEVVVQQAAPAPAPVPTPAPIAVVAPIAPAAPPPVPVRAVVTPPPVPVRAVVTPPAEPVAPPPAVLPLADWHADRIAKAKPRPKSGARGTPPAAKRPVGRPRRDATPASNGRIAASVKTPAQNSGVAAQVTKPAQNARVAAVVKTPAKNGRVAKGARFSVQFQVQTVLRAADMHDALRQAQALGAIELLAITRET